MSRATLAVRLSLALASAAALATPALAGTSQTFSGATLGSSPAFNRPNELCTALSGQNVRYHEQTFFLPTGAQCYVTSAQTHDGFLHLYSGTFDPANPLQGCEIGNDQGLLGAGTSAIPPLFLPSGLYTLVTSAAAAGQIGSFWNTIHCDGNVQAVQGSCAFEGYPREQQVCHHDRFAVRILNISNHPSDGRGTPARMASSDSSFWWFYNDRNFEVMMKVLNACANNQHFWVFTGALTNQAYTLQVLDTLSQQVNTYTNALGVSAPAVTDTSAFPCDPETGDPGDPLPCPTVVECTANQVCECPAGQTCCFSCPGGGCTIDSGSQSLTHATCDGGGCDYDCGGTSTCNLGCAGGGCSYNCGGSSQCNLTCSGGTCNLNCGGASTCDLECSFACSTTCGTLATCSQTCEQPGTCTCLPPGAC